MSRPSTGESYPIQGNNRSTPGDPQPNYGVFNQGAEGSQGNGTRLTDEDKAEIQWQGEEIAGEVRKLGQAMLLILVTIVASRLGPHT